MYVLGEAGRSVTFEPSRKSWYPVGAGPPSGASQASREVTRKPGSATSPTMAQAETAKPGEDRSRYWHFHNAIRWNFDDANNMISREEFDDLEIPMEEDLDRFLSTTKQKQEMRFSELREEAAAVRRPLRILVEPVGSPPRSLVTLWGGHCGGCGGPRGVRASIPVASPAP